MLYQELSQGKWIGHKDAYLALVVVMHRKFADKNPLSSKMEYYVTFR
jgi:hypothetical protein